MSIKNNLKLISKVKDKYKRKLLDAAFFLNITYYVLND